MTLRQHGAAAAGRASRRPQNEAAKAAQKTKKYLQVVLPFYHSMWGKLIRIGGDETTQVASRFALTDDIVFFGRVSSITPDPGGQFSHKQQFAIPCVYVSSTHFSISVYYEPVSINNDVAAEGVKDTSNVSLQPHFRIQDFARNGTFLNGELIGMKNCKDLKEGDEISLRYKGKILIVYKFEGVSINVHEGPSAHEHLAQSSPTRRGSGTSQPTPNKQAAFQGQMSSATKNLLAESLAQQIVVLQEEAVVSNSRIAAQCQQIDHFHLELEKTHRKVKNEEKLREEAMKEVIELKEQITAMNSNQTALEARAKILHDENEELEKYVKDLKTKVNQLQDELKEKANQVEKRSNLLEDSNRALQEEQSHRQLVEAQLHDVQLLLDTSQVRAQNCELAIKDLQFINQELERKISEWVVSVTAYLQLQQTVDIVLFFHRSSLIFKIILFENYKPNTRSRFTKQVAFVSSNIIP